MSRTVAAVLISTTFLILLACTGCGDISGASFPYTPSPRVEVAAPASPAGGNVTVSFLVIDRELEPVDTTVEFSTDGGVTFVPATLVTPGDALNLASAWSPGRAHSVQWDSVADGLAISGQISVRVKVTPSDASNPSGTPGITAPFILDNTAFNQPPTAGIVTPGGVQFGNVPVDYTLTDAEGNDCSVVVEYTANNGTNWYTATRRQIGEGLTGLSSSPSGEAHLFIWDSVADNVALSGQIDTVKVRVTPTDFHEGTAGVANSFSVDNTLTNDAPTVAITAGPLEGSTIYATQVAFTFSGSDTDGTVTGYFYSFDLDPPDLWTASTTAISGVLDEGSHTFRVVALDDSYNTSTPLSRTFNIITPGTIVAEFTAAPLSGTSPLTVSFTDLSAATHGLTGWSWDFGDTNTSTVTNPVHIYNDAGTFTVSLTVTGPDGSDAETKTDYVTVSLPDSIYCWTHRMGAISDDWAQDICADGSGNVYVTGRFYQTPDFGDDWGQSDPKTSAGSQDAFITKILASGAYGWTHRLGGPSWDAGYHLCADGSGNICVGGYYESATVNFAEDWGGSDIKSLTGARRMFFTKINANGTYAWTHTIPGQGSYTLGGICADGLGNIYVTGYFDNTVNFRDDWSSTDNKTSAGSHDVFITKMASDGSYLWTHTIGATQRDWPFAICTDQNNDIYVAGAFTGAVNFAMSWAGNDIKTSAGWEDAFVTKISSGGSYVWTRIMGDAEDERIDRICTDGSTGLYVGGAFYSDTVNFQADWSGTDTKDCVGPSGDVFVTKMTTAGGYQWTHTVGNSTWVYLSGVCADTTGVYVGGTFSDILNFERDWSGDDVESSAGIYDVYIMKIAANGDYGWVYTIGGAESEGTPDICSDGAGNIYIPGWFRSTLDFGLDWGAIDEKTSMGQLDVFVTKIKVP